MTLTERGRKLIGKYGYNFRTVYSCRHRITPRRMERLMRLYCEIAAAGEIDERDYFDPGRSRKTLLADLHLLEELGLVKCTLDFGAESASFADCFIRK